MKSVNLGFNESSGTCLITAPELPEEYWAKVRAAFDFGGGSYVARSSRELEVPLWSILRCRDDLGPVFRTLTREIGWTVTIDQAIRDALGQASQRQKALLHATVPQTGEEVRTRLLELGFARELKDYQAENVAKLLRFSAGATFSVPGAGKTTEALAYYALRREKNHRLLVVCPKNAFAVWEEQLSICLPLLTVGRLTGSLESVNGKLAEDYDVLLINYELVPRTQSALYSGMAQRPTALFVDESHRIKSGVDRLYAGAVIALGAFASPKLILTGTPMPNARADVIPQFQFLYPELKVSPDQAVSRLQEVFVRTTKDQLDIAPPKRLSVDVPMSLSQARLYKALSNELARSAMSLRVSEKMLFRRIGKSVMNLLQAASDPALLADSDLGYHDLLLASMEEPSPKIVKACELARDLAHRGQKCIIWTTFVENVRNLASLLDDLDAQYIYGGVRVSDDDEDLESREGRIKRFKENSDTFVLVANPAACAESISLHKVCHHAIYVDRTYNAAHYVQSEDRIHRLGLGPHEETYIYLLRSSGTIDDSVDRRLQQKVQRMSLFLNDRSLSVAALPAESENLEQELGLNEADWQDLKAMLNI